MNHDHLFATAAIAATLAMGSPSATADYLPPSVEARLQAAADQGPDQLRQFVWRTRMIYNIRMQDVGDRLAGDYSDAAVGTSEGEPEAPGAATPDTASSQDDAFNQAFFRNDATD